MVNNEVLDRMRCTKYLVALINTLALSLTNMAIVSGAIWFSTGSCFAQSLGDKPLGPVKASLAGDRGKIVLGKPFKVYVDFEMEPGWHIYYKDPGQTGMPTAVDFTLPPGFSAQPLRWPAYETFKESGIVTYGYSRKLRLSTFVTPSKTLKSGQIVTLKASAKWLACKHSCIPGSSAMSVDLKVQAK
jgi:DsbC/DsbD-like thiol-disulfide interchange protein